ncbi:MAG: acyl-CoA thioesterase [Planctomycetaceae bacterium]|nr:acyl-CoA thioesterase [Planctomycetaceae bacterium]
MEVNDSFSYELRVRYQETDGQGIVHHGNYFTYFEKARIEFLRHHGISYRDIEDSGLMLVVSEARAEYCEPAKFDDILHVSVSIARIKGAAIDHSYVIKRGDSEIVRGFTRVGCLDKEGRVKRVPTWLGGKGDWPIPESLLRG